VPTLVFDEVDAGIGGRVASVVGQTLAAAAQGRQVLCVTHLAPIAALAHHHLRVSKSVRAGRTKAAVTALAAAERVEEIARMLGGASVTAAAASTRATCWAQSADGRGEREGGADPACIMDPRS